MTGEGFNAAWDSVVRPGASGRGTLRCARTSDFDSLDPGNTYYAFVWNFVRLIGRPLLTYRPVPGPGGGTAAGPRPAVAVFSSRREIVREEAAGVSVNASRAIS